ncbi:hypothetical protein XM38_035270 [Halomicronema hongdechloris C2206]|uniref:histidine kinase n=1 Tax=Halomicronema hongdechloris C2206 TaxID=1641165 RepID=A0A1Z3HQH6_9CYAN|nr:HAMP domain-containing sensor histidine kinase [Halomicronema hongdechloris]ASC72569.1 hypothetical protein XM38_035270 [Halomicronema hongdechloris C2206]
MSKLNLRSRLLLSHLMVMAVGIVTLASVSWIYSPKLFIITLQRIERYGIGVRQVRTDLIQGFESAWARGMTWSILLGGGAAGSLSFLLSRRIVQPLLQLEQVTRKFATGDLEERVPASDIPELDQLATSFNRMADDLAGVEQRRRELIGDLTHELRTPLTIVKGYLEGLADGTIEPSPDIYRRLARETTRLKRLVNDLQELSKLEAGYLPIQAQPMALCPLLAGLVHHFDNQLVDGQVQLTLECPNNLPLVKADPERVEQIVVNLLSNALRHTARGSVWVTALAVQGQVWVQVQDTGTGIAEADLPYIFERFWRAKPASKDTVETKRDQSSSEGSGVGLTICRRLVELQGGRIEVESQPGQGSTFRFSLPIAADNYNK